MIENLGPLASEFLFLYTYMSLMGHLSTDDCLTNLRYFLGSFTFSYLGHQVSLLVLHGLDLVCVLHDSMGNTVAWEVLTCSSSAAYLKSISGYYRFGARRNN